MKKIKLLIIPVLLLQILFTYAANDAKTLVIKTVIYCDHCMNCGSCGDKLVKDLGFEKGVKLVKLNEKEMTIQVMYNPKKTTPEKIRQKISLYGYDADHVKANPEAYEKLDECCKRK